MNKNVSAVVLMVAILLFGCNQQIGDYIAASSISRDGFAISKKALDGISGKEVKLWGFVDHGNLYGDVAVKAILQEWWSGDGPSASSWRFNLKANADDAVGHSFPVHVANDAGRNALLQRFLADARAGRATKVFMTGRLFTFAAPTNISPLTGIYMEVQSSNDILFEPQGEQR
jgi:hypothetical protein